MDAFCQYPYFNDMSSACSSLMTFSSSRVYMEEMGERKRERERKHRGRELERSDGWLTLTCLYLPGCIFFFESDASYVNTTSNWPRTRGRLVSESRRYSTEKYATTSQQRTHQRDLRNDVTLRTEFYVSPTVRLSMVHYSLA